MEAIYSPELTQPLSYKQSSGSGDSNRGVSRNYTCIFTAAIVLVKRYSSSSTTVIQTPSQETTGKSLYHLGSNVALDSRVM